MMLFCWFVVLVLCLLLVCAVVAAAGVVLCVVDVAACCVVVAVGCIGCSGVLLFCWFAVLVLCLLLVCCCFSGCVGLGWSMFFWPLVFSFGCHCVCLVCLGQLCFVCLLSATGVRFVHHCRRF